MPDWRQKGWADAPGVQKGVEANQMPLFLLAHMPDLGGRFRRSAATLQNRELSLVNACRTVFAGLIDPKDPFDPAMRRKPTRHARIAARGAVRCLPGLLKLPMFAHARIVVGSASKRNRPSRGVELRNRTGVQYAQTGRRLTLGP